MAESTPWTIHNHGLFSSFIVSTAGTFEVVGTTDEILSIAKVTPLVTCDLRQQYIMPDILDAHTHLLSAG
jgi:predicted amidohydrolase YtcJ